MSPLRPTSPGSRAAPTLEQVKHTLRGLIESNAGIPAALIRDDSTIEGDLAMDSLSFVSLQVAVEDTFDIPCEPADLEARNRFDAIAAFVYGLTQGNRPQPARAPRVVAARTSPRRPTSPRALARNRKARPKK